MVPGNGSNRESTKKRRIALLLQYDGTNFNGWQIQKSGRTVQGEVEKALKILLKEKTRVIASGRTDAGVHALGQVVHFDVKDPIDLKRLCTGLNGILDKDVSIKNAYHVLPDFHARFSAVEREYIYIFYNYPLKSPFVNNKAMWLHEMLDVEYLRKVSAFLIGEKDFASFCKTISSGGNTIRKINYIEITSNNDLIFFRIRGNAFLHNMIRVIIGTIIEMFKKKSPPEYILEIIDGRDREFGGVTAPPYALYLNKVTYNPPLDNMESAY